jgi:hypothetical protein
MNRPNIPMTAGSDPAQVQQCKTITFRANERPQTGRPTGSTGKDLFLWYTDGSMIACTIAGDRRRILRHENHFQARSLPGAWPVAAAAREFT